MTTRIPYAEDAPSHTSGGWVRLFRILILLGVWILVGLAGLAVWLRLTS